MQLLKAGEMRTSDGPAGGAIEVSDAPRGRNAQVTESSQAPESLGLGDSSVQDEASDSKLSTEPSPPAIVDTAVVDPAAPPSTEPPPGPSQAPSSVYKGKKDFEEELMYQGRAHQPGNSRGKGGKKSGRGSRK